MSTTIDSAGRIVVPKSIREAAGFAPGMALDVRFRDGRIEIEPAPVHVQLVRRGRVLVAVPDVPGPVLTTEEVEATVASLRDERG